jgi:hypothetical protein
VSLKEFVGRGDEFAHDALDLRGGDPGIRGAFHRESELHAAWLERPEGKIPTYRELTLKSLYDYSRQAVFGAVYKCLQVVGVNSADKEHMFERYLRESAISPSTTVEISACSAAAFTASSPARTTTRAP